MKKFKDYSNSTYDRLVSASGRGDIVRVESDLRYHIDHLEWLVQACWVMSTSQSCCGSGAKNIEDCISDACSTKDIEMIIMLLEMDTKTISQYLCYPKQKHTSIIAYAW